MKLKKIETTEEYWKKHKEYKKRISRLFRKAYKFINKPSDFAEEYDKILDEMEFIELVTPEWTQQQRERFYEMLNYPQELRQWLEDNAQRIKQVVTCKK